MSNELDIPKLENSMLSMEQVDCSLVHRFAPGVYLREIFMPAGSFVLGHEHNTEHLNIVIRGRARVLIDGVIQEIVAGDTFVSGAGVRKTLYILEDTVWQTVHPTDETNVEKLETLLITKSLVHLTDELRKELFG
jgi:quercetin dioxygenase-like cupin family protein